MKNSIVICMGSSCFARGNGEHLEQIEEYLQKNQLDAEIQFSGCRCRDECGSGPNIEINGTLYRTVDTGTLHDLLAYHFPEIEKSTV